MCQGTRFPAWQANCIRQLLALPGASPVLLIVDDRARSALSTLLRTPPDKWLSLVHRRWFARPSAMSLEDLSEELGHLPRLSCVAQLKGEHSESFDLNDVSEIRDLELDFILKFAFNTLGGDILDAARFGVWAFQHADEKRYRGCPHGFWEVFRGDPATGASLQRLTDSPDTAIILKRGSFPTSKYSYRSNYDRVLRESSCWPTDICLQILSGKEDHFNASPSSTEAPTFGTPTTLQMFAYFFRTLRNSARDLFRLLFVHEEWHIGVLERPIESCLNSSVPKDVKWLPKPERGRFIADPFGIARDDGIHLLCEDFGYGEFRGRITAIELCEKGHVLESAAAIDDGLHLSYPYLLEHDGELYCIPESCAQREVRLYKVGASLASLTWVATLIEDFPAIDTTVFRYEGRWWLICGNSEDGRFYKLFAWYAEDLFGPWEPHLLNPIKVDVRSARPGGTPFMHEGTLYRPAQNCAETYGGNLIINRVIRLTPKTFEEEVAHELKPDPNGPYPHGLHTISRAGESTLIDGKRYDFYLGGFLYGLRFLARKAWPERARKSL